MTSGPSWPMWRVVPYGAAAVLGVIGLTEVLLDPVFSSDAAAPLVGLCLVVIGTVIAAYAPITGVIVAAAMFPAMTVLGLDGPTGVGVLTFFLLPGWAGYRRATRRSWIAAAGSQLMASLGIVLAGWVTDPERALETSTAWENLFFSCLCWASWAVGVLLRRTRARADQLAQLAAALDAEREARDQAIVIEERQRIAREVHDAVAHSVSVMVLQVGALRSTMPADDPHAAVLEGVERLGRESVNELRGLVGILREQDSGPPAPQPSLTRAEDLLADVRAAGLPVELRVAGTSGPIPRAVDVSAYRIIQEALTNVLRHAGAVPTVVTLRHSRDALTVEVENAAPPEPAAAVVPIMAGAATGVGGHGLVGMRERLAMFGGSLDVGPRPAGGFAVRARFPIRRTP